jgi:hypothetical protein
MNTDKFKSISTAEDAEDAEETLFNSMSCLSVRITG